MDRRYQIVQEQLRYARLATQSAMNVLETTILLQQPAADAYQTLLSRLEEEQADFSRLQATVKELADEAQARYDKQ